MRGVIFLRLIVVATLLCAFLSFVSTTTLASEPEAGTPNNERTQLTGDWGGARTSLEERGIIIDVQATQFYQAVVDGSPGTDDGQYGLKLDYFLTLIGEKLGLWKGLSAVIHAESRIGDDVNALTGISPANGNMLWPVIGEDKTTFTEFIVNQELGHEMVLAGGKLNPLDFWELAFQTGRGVDKFMNTSFLLPLSMARTVPLSYMGAALMKLKGHEVQGSLAVYDPNDCAADTLFCLDDLYDDVAVVGLWKFFHDSRHGGRPGYVAFGGNWSGKQYTAIDPSGFAIIPGEGLTLTDTQESWNVFSVVHHQLWADPTNPNRDLRFTGQLVLSDGEANPLEVTASGALEMTGVIPRRNKDTLGVGAYYVGLSSGFKDVVGPLLSVAKTLATGTPASISLQETKGLEIYYKAQVTPWFAITGDVQVIDPGINIEDTKVVAGVRGKVTF